MIEVMTCSFTYKGRAAVLDRLADISRTGISDYMRAQSAEMQPANDLILPTCLTPYLLEIVKLRHFGNRSRGRGPGGYWHKN